MLGVLRIGVVLTGVAAGSLTAAVVYLVGLTVARALHIGQGAYGQGAGAALALALLAGMTAAGVLAGRLAPVNGRFHGSVAGLGMAGIVIVIARFSGSPAPTSQVLLLALIGAVVGGASGWWGDRHR
jgi:hypothetical protein